MTMLSKMAAGLACAVVAVGTISLGQDDPAKSEPKAKAEAAKAKGAGRGGFPDLVKGLKETPGCLGVETARTSTGKQVIFAWFENKKAALAWYNSSMHKGLMQGMGAGEARGLRQLADDGKPVLAIACITPSDKPKIEGFPAPISQISIELYQPLPGGISVNGSFAPSTLDVPHMKRLDAEGKDTTKPEAGAK